MPTEENVHVASAHQVKAEMNATVWKVEVTEGQAIVPGDVIVILESMKMEIPVMAPVGGQVTAVHVAPEDVLREGDLVAVIDAA